MQKPGASEAWTRCPLFRSPTILQPWWSRDTMVELRTPESEVM